MKNNNHKKINNNHKTDIFDSEVDFHLIREIEQNPKATQRDLAKKLTVSLGKMNFLINALVDKGIIKIHNFKNSNRKFAYMYLLTPYGIKTKLHLVREFLEWKIGQYEKLKKEIESYKKEVLSYKKNKEMDLT